MFCDAASFHCLEGYRHLKAGVRPPQIGNLEPGFQMRSTEFKTLVGCQLLGGPISAASGCSSSTAIASSGKSRWSASVLSALRGRRLGPEDLYAFGASGEIVGTLTEVGIVRIAVEVAVSQIRSDSKPTRPDGDISAKYVQTATAQAEVFDDVEYLLGLLDTAKLGLFRDDQIDVDVGVYEVAVGASAYSALDAHQAVFFGPLKHCAGLEVLQVNRVLDVRLDPAYVLASAEAPLS